MLSAIIVAAGSSRRVGFDKIAAPIAGRTVIGHALSAFQNCAAVAEMIVVARVDRIHDLQSLLEGRFTKFREIVAGGAHRQDSVCAGLAAVSAEADFIGVHDAARPLVTPELIERVFAEAQPHGAAAAAGPVTDTLKRATAEHVVCGGVDRENLYAMQTPQIFSRSLLVQAYERVEADRVRVTDEVSAVEHIGAKVVLVPNNEQNFKITFPEDLRIAELVLAARLRH